MRDGSFEYIGDESFGYIGDDKFYLHAKCGNFNAARKSCSYALVTSLVSRGWTQTTATMV